MDKPAGTSGLSVVRFLCEREQRPLQVTSRTPGGREGVRRSALHPVNPNGLAQELILANTKQPGSHHRSVQSKTRTAAFSSWHAVGSSRSKGARPATSASSRFFFQRRCRSSRSCLRFFELGARELPLALLILPHPPPEPRRAAFSPCQVPGQLFCIAGELGNIPLAVDAGVTHRPPRRTSPLLPARSSLPIPALGRTRKTRLAGLGPTWISGA
jgi:hypothetical protein